MAVHLPRQGRGFCGLQPFARKHLLPRLFPRPAQPQQLPAADDAVEASEVLEDALKSASHLKKDASRERELILYLRQCFLKADTNRDGILDRKEFLAWTLKDSNHERLRDLGVQLPPKALRKAYDMLDLDGDGSLDMDEFVKGMSYIQDALSADDRKQRFAIDGILRRLESVRMSVSLFSGKILPAFLVVLGITGLASFSGLSPVWCASSIPAGASALMLGASVAETTGSWSRGSARYSAAKALEQAFRAEMIVAEADIEKAFIPFGVGLTGIAAAASGAIKAIIQQQRDLLNENEWFTDLLDAGDFAVAVLALAAVIGASITSDQSLRMRTTLRACDQDELYDDRPNRGTSKSWMERARQPVKATLKTQDRVANAATTLVLCLLPLPFVQTVVQAPDVPALINAVAVVVAEVAAALAAVTFVYAELDFANVERRVAIQCRNASLAELFSAQTTAEAAALPASTALSGAALGGTSLFVEISRWIAMVLPWPGGVAAVRSTLGAVLARLEARAAWLQRGLSTAGKRQQASTDVLASALRELGRAVSEFEEDPESDKVREDLCRLPVGRTTEFEALTRQDRRKVHLVASDLGMSSQSIDRFGVRVVRVTNLGARPEEDDGGLFSLLTTALAEARALGEDGVPQDSRAVFGLTALAGITGAATPLLAGKLGAEFALPLVTAALALGTVQQERSGTMSAATARRYAAGVQQLLADANSLLAKAHMTFSLVPTAFAVSTLATTISIVGLAHASGSLGVAIYIVVLPAFPTALAAYVLTVVRLRRTVDYVRRTSILLDAEAPACRAAMMWKWFILLAVGAWLLPCSVCQRLTLASAVLMGGTGVMMAAGAVQVATGDNYVARSSVICACADAWSQRSDKAIRLLPFESAAAVVTAVLSSAIAEESLLAASSFPLAGAMICLRALQLQGNATVGMRQAKMAASCLQVPACAWPWDLPSREISSSSTSGSQEILTLPSLPAWRLLFKQYDSRRELRQSTSRPGLLAVCLAGLKRFGEGRRVQQEFGPNPAESTVQNVQRDLDELYATRDSRTRGFSGTFTLLGTFTIGCLFTPLVFSGSAEVILPVAGAALTLFTAAEESRIRQLVASAKMRAAEITAVVAAMEVQLSASAPYRARLLAATGLTAMAAVAVVALEHSAAVGALPCAWLVAVLVVQAFTAAWCVWPLQAVFYWAGRVRQMTSVSTARPLETMGLGVDTPACGGLSFGCAPVALPPRRRLWTLLFAMPVVALAMLPPGRSFPQRAAASAAAGAQVVAAALFVAELSAARAERMIATRATTFALTDAFANEGEQQSVLLPLAGASSIALSALIAFLVELNTFAASALTVLQTVTWVLAARRGVAAKYYSKGAMQVNAVTERPAMTGK